MFGRRDEGEIKQERALVGGSLKEKGLYQVFVCSAVAQSP